MKLFFGLLSSGLALASYIPYFRDIIRRQTKPHAYSWLIWGILSTIVYIGELVSHGGAGSWVFGVMAIANLTIFIIALRRNENDINLADKLCLAGAGVAILLWLFGKQPLYSVILVTIIDLIGFWPTTRKTIMKPFAESLPTYVLGWLSYATSLLALGQISWVTAFYPSSLVVTELSFITLMLVRRYQVRRRS